MKLAFAIAAAALLGTASVQAADANHGKELVNKDCSTCHKTEVYSRKDRKVTSMGKLESQVRRCDSIVQTQWFEDDIKDVVHYLNVNYYKFN